MEEVQTQASMSLESNIEWIERRLRRLEYNQTTKALDVRLRAIELVMGRIEMVGGVIPTEEVISRADAISNFILNGPKVPFNEATEEGHMAANFVQAMNWLDEQGISRADEGGDYSIIHRIKLLAATTNVAVTPKGPEKD